MEIMGKSHSNLLHRPKTVAVWFQLTMNAHEWLLRTLCWLEWPKFIFRNLQSVQNMAAHMVHGVCRSEHITRVLEDLRWLPVSQWVVFKTALMVWKCVHGVAPAYLSDLCIPATAISGRHHLRSAATGTLLVWRARTATRRQSFAVNGPATWNHLPPALQSPDLSQSAFKRVLFLTARRHWDVFMILALDINIQTYLLTWKWNWVERCW